jgi:hypothetical protein
MEPTNDHERIIARAVDELFLKGNRRHSVERDYLDVAMALDMTIS